MKSFFGVVNISKRKNKDSVIYAVSNINDLVSAIIPHFRKFNLLI